MLTYEILKTKPRDLLAATGLKQNEFEALLAAFEKAYEEAYPAHRTVRGQLRQRGKGGGNKGTLRRIDDKLLFILVYQKTYPLQSMLGLQFGISQGRANEWIDRLSPILAQALVGLKMTPERDGQALATNELALVGGPDLLIDGTQRRRQRPQAEPAQREAYSGKKSPHR